jgi:N-acetylglutamate synthase-like GNAT family acetyltransferase
MEIRIIKTGTADYDKMIDLRMKVLLDPIGIPRSYINPEKEETDTLIAAFEKEDMIGCCILTHIDPSTIQLRQMAVDTSLQKKGVGAAIVSFAEAWSKENGYQKLVMHARDSVLDFYKKCGYSVSGPQFFEVGIGHHKMEKELV